MMTPVDTHSDILLSDTTDRVRTITLNRPQARNALSAALRTRFFAALREAESDDGVDVVIVTGTDPVFCAGLDLKELGRDAGALGSIEARSVDPVTAIEACPKPVIAAVNGVAVTGGFELALACDVLIASERARFADTHGRVGIMPGWGLSQKLSRLIGPYRAKEISLSGNFIEAATAERWGLVNRVVAHGEVLAAAQALARDMAEIDPGMLAGLKRLIDEGYALPYREARALETETSRRHNATVVPGEVEARRTAVRDRGRASI